MTPRNSYATLSEFKNYFTSRGGSSIPSDTTDDAVLEQLLETASRFLDSKTGYWFYPRIETRNYDIPYGDQRRDLYFDAPLLEVITLTNGDGTTIASTQYNLPAVNESPKFALRMKWNSSVVWELDSGGENEYVIAVKAINGYHTRYSDAWVTGSTLAEALDTTETAWDMTDGSLFSPGQIIKVGNELTIVSGVATNTVSVLQRGDNGSTAAAANSGATVYIWRPMAEARNAVLEIANQAKARRFGQSISSTETVTASGIVLSPRDIPAMAAEFIKTYQRRV